MSFFKILFAARCPKCGVKLRYTGWNLPYPQYICIHCTDVEAMKMDMDIVYRKTLEERNAAQQISRQIKRRREKAIRSTTPKKLVADRVLTQGRKLRIRLQHPFNEDLYICKNFSTRSSICDRCRCNIWHNSDYIIDFFNYKDCYEPTVFEINLDD